MRKIVASIVGALTSVIVLFMHASPLVRGATRSMLYASVGAELSAYDVGVDGASLTKRSSVTLPGYVQEAWRHPSKGVLYVAWSNGGPLYAGTASGTPPAPTRSGITAFAIDSASGALRPHGEAASLRARPIYITCDIPGTHLLAAYNEPSGISVRDLRADGTIGSEVAQPDRLDTGVYAHQVRVSPTNTAVILVTRGNEPTPAKAEDPGAVKVFRYRDGALTNLASIAPNGGMRFRSRHIDFHPMRPWLFLTLEAQNKLEVYRRLEDDTLTPSPLFARDTLADPKADARQATSSVHVHPNGAFVYVANRAAGTANVDGKSVFAGGENSVAVFAINQTTGEPTRVQNVDTAGIQPRTFAIDPSGRLLVVGNQTSMLVRNGATMKTVGANLALFRIGADGRLTFVRSYDVHADGKPLLWVGIVSV